MLCLGSIGMDCVINESYCKFRNFCANFIFANSVKRHFCELKKSQVEHDLPISVKDIEILPFPERFIFTKLRKCKVS